MRRMAVYWCTPSIRPRALFRIKGQRTLKGLWRSISALLPGAEMCVQGFGNADQQGDSDEKINDHGEDEEVLRPDRVPDDPRRQGQHTAQGHLDEPVHTGPA